jgi:hypothetical protein
MEHEISSHTKKAFATMGKSEHSIWEKIKEVALEVAIIIFAVMVSIWFHDRSEHKHQQAEVKEFLEGLRDDLQKDTTSMKSQIIKHEKTVKDNALIATINSIENYQNLKKKGIEISLTTEYSFRSENSGNYKSFESSGKLGYLENKELKKRILLYYHATNSAVTKLENMYDKNIDKMIELMPKYKERSDLLFDRYFKQTIFLQKEYSKGLISFYKEVVKESEKTLKLIDEELKEL